MSEASNNQPSGGQEMPFLSHLVELRDRLLRIVMVVIGVFAVLTMYPGLDEIFTFFSAPLLNELPENTQMIATSPISPFFTPVKLGLMLAIFITIPWSLYQIWGFIAPGLYTHEKYLVTPLLISSTVLFYLGMAFAYFVVFPLVFEFMVNATPTGVSMMTDISSYLDFVLKLFFAFGVAFEVPVATFLLIWTGATTPESLSEKRPYIIVGAFVIAMLMTPPDIISQTLLAVPVLILFEVGLIFSKIMLRKRAAMEAAEAAKPEDELSLDDLDEELDRLSEEEEQRRGKDS
ncbi:twin-arginine translocase subunit TatC [Candidatus Albibeggiatoa sp. nov. NOAA]|uniref:twin-arginine translocase subunit TatC n=1 Tax=Candidatus Albibeggiatoa sp. nov. NOAA TaxID=3162724 RepID=UPI0032F44C34|nr:twin-arginine translocase subunit TatC [Thiotrichaceae bacterium]